MLLWKKKRSFTVKGNGMIPSSEKKVKRRDKELITEAIWRMPRPCGTKIAEELSYLCEIRTKEGHKNKILEYNDTSASFYRRGIHYTCYTNTAHEF